jgi:hypothetical protein
MTNENLTLILKATKQMLETCEVLGVESFGEYISDVVMGINVGEGIFLGLDTLAKEVVCEKACSVLRTCIYGSF